MGSAAYLFFFRLIIVVAVIAQLILVNVVLIVKLIIIELAKVPFMIQSLASEPVDGAWNQFLLDVFPNGIVKLQTLLDVFRNILLIVFRWCGG